LFLEWLGILSSHLTQLLELKIAPTHLVDLLAKQLERSFISVFSAAPIVFFYGILKLFAIALLSSSSDITIVKLTRKNLPGIVEWS
jgi:hypothetical protein